VFNISDFTASLALAAVPIMFYSASLALAAVPIVIV
jgi:hypothetical protein